jgi:hypothetical protein
MVGAVTSVTTAAAPRLIEQPLDHVSDRAHLDPLASSPFVAAVAPAVPARSQTARYRCGLRVKDDKAVGGWPAIVTRVADEIVMDLLFPPCLGILTTAMQRDVQSALLRAARVGRISPIGMDMSVQMRECLRARIRHLGMSAADVAREADPGGGAVGRCRG